MKSNQLSTYKAQEIDSLATRVLLGYRKDFIFEKWTTVLEVKLKVVQFALPKRFVHKVILVCHDDNGHLGVE